LTRNHTEGQTNRKMNVIDIEDLLHELLPEAYDILAGKIAFKMSLCPDTVKYSYLSMFMAEKIIWMDKHGIVYLTEKTPIQDIDNEVKEEKQELDLGLEDFIKSNKYEKLSNLELIKKIDILKNEKLKTNWITQIKNRKEQ